MNEEFRIVALVGKYQSADVAESITRMACFLQEHGLEVWLEEGTAQTVGRQCTERVASFDVIGEHADLVIVIGGDGSMLTAARALAGHNLPVVGINQGRLGFLTDVSREDMFTRISDILEGRFLRERRSLLEAEVWRHGARVFTTTALNDIVLSRGEIGRMIEFELHVDTEYIYSQRSDGIIVSTPTGSTAYALSANGPILHPRLAGIVLVPLCPHGLTYRPLALAQDSVVELVILGDRRCMLHSDGQTLFETLPGDRVRVRRSTHGVTLLHPENYSYFAVLREKLHWSAPPHLS
ncbi:MAG: NAD kinase [Candidatus Dactylopiibacterium carminicum]|uniref:NAD kinase n=1 Tax=Candidatus Dactylopiibacterium carminicum TaxID=857335 RepID=A0A272EU72_9RHOO|nr:NAD(+) kinase [Candidatus Dactylopiibacterium carminicum]KAF7599701.1 NAD(+) kinase [Candidatus Dactylopiibacterium carminicum]PAS93637.1 MAG: NAD kinase [Candidatus Dactylopiibacterium carminicum]PAS97504.1 MAG: NAD kinase [Candidatus Dactylopiibacterium carminicum]PAS99702.1 MAG: NAD kinase [Candidatus Dactylopiibacterium carminicum]